MTETETEAETRAGTAGAEAGSAGAGRLVAVAVVAAALAWSYAPELAWLGDFWVHDPNYSHGFLVPPVAAWVFWRRRSLPGVRATRPWPWGWLLLALVLAARSALFARGKSWSDAFTLLPAVACLVLTLGGRGLFRRAWPAVAYLGFMLPLPGAVNGLLAGTLQGLATDGSAALLRMTGLWVITEGNVIYVGKQPLMVAEACNGLSMLMCLAATVTAAALLLRVSVWVRAVLALSAVPAALASNVLRITATGWCYHWFGAERGGRIAHDAAGWLMMPTALALVGLEVAVLSWLIVEEVEETQPSLLGRPISRGRGRLEAPGGPGGGPGS